MTASNMQIKILKLQRKLKRLQKIWNDIRHTSNKIYVTDRVSQYREMWRKVAEKSGAKFRTLSDDVWEIEMDGIKTRMLNHQMEFDSPVTLGMAANKPLIHRLFAENGLPVPEHIVFRLEELEKAYSFLNKYPAGCVIKPANGTSHGDGITTHIKTNYEARKAAILASLYCPDMLMEPQVPGECYRLLILNGKMIHAVRRKGISVQGDGSSTILELIESNNNNTGNQGRRILGKDDDCQFNLTRQNLSLDSIPRAGKKIMVKSFCESEAGNVEIRTVYNENVTDLICDSAKECAEHAATVLNSVFVGVDIIMTDPTIPLEESGGVIDEVNTTPGLHHHFNLKDEKFPEAAMLALKVLLNRYGEIKAED